MYTPVKPQFYYIKVGFKGVKIICFRNTAAVDIGQKKPTREHYENTPIQIYRKFHLQKLKIFR